MTIAILTPWYGPDLHGGAERVAFEAAERMARRGHAVTVLTTCARSFDRNWSENFYRAGTTVENGVTVVRFPVRKRNVELFNRVNQKLVSLPASALKRGVNPVTAEEAQIFADENINSDELIEHLRSRGADYQAILLIPYLYGPILKGWRFVADRAYLQPCLHDEAYARLPAVDEMMRGVRGLLFNSEGEREIALRLFGPGLVSRSLVVGSAIDLPDSGGAATVGMPHGFAPGKERFVLYLGRRTATKNVDFLVAAFREFKMRYPDSRLRLALAGTGSQNYDDPAAGIADLAFVSEAQKVALLRSTAAVVQPSLNESYSRTLMEAWLCGKPVAVHAKCAATAQAMRSAGGGWIADSLADWVQVFAAVETLSSDELSELGARAAVYVRAFASWDGVLERYEEAMLEQAPPKRAHERSVWNVVDEMRYGEPITIQALALRDTYRSLGIHAEIFSPRIDKRVEHEAAAGSPPDGAVLVVQLHQSADVLGSLAGMKNPRVLVVHGDAMPITAELQDAASGCVAVYASSPVTRRRLENLLGRTVLQYTTIVNPQRWNVTPDPTLMAALQDERTNILCVNAIDESNGQIELLEVFAQYLTLDLNARLILAGRYRFEDPYYQQLLRTVHGSALSQHVLIPGMVSEPALAALYATAHVYCTLSRAEILGSALVEAMWFDVPVCAFNSPIAASMLGPCGVLLNETGNALNIAGLLRVMATDPGVRAEILKSQRERRLRFSPHAVSIQAQEMLEAAEELLVAEKT